MTAKQEILKLIEQASKNGDTFNLQDTLIILENIKENSERKELLSKLQDIIVTVKDSPTKQASLSPRESQVFKLIGSGLLSKDIAKLLGITEATVTTHRKNIIKKIGLKGTNQLNVEAFRQYNNIRRKSRN